MTDMFTTPPAGAPLAPNNSVRYYYRRQVFTATPSTKDDHVAGRECSWRFAASGQHAFVPQESRLVAKVKVQKSVDGGTTYAAAPEASVRYAADLLSRLYDQARLSINGTTVASTATNVQEVAHIQLALEGTQAGGAACGSAGLLSMDQRMHHPDAASTGVGTDGYATDMGTGAVTAVPTQFDATAAGNREREVRNMKHDILLQRGSGEHEISTPLGQLFPFFRQSSAFLRNMELDLRLVVSATGAEDALVTETIPAQPRSQGLTVKADATSAMGSLFVANTDAMGTVGDLDISMATANDLTLCQLLPAVGSTAVDDNTGTAGPVWYRVFVESLYIDAMFAASRTPLPPPVSVQIPFQDVSVFQRTLSASADHNLTFTGIPPSVTALVFALKDDLHKFSNNRERYSVGGGDRGFRTFNMQMGSLSFPQPNYQLDTRNLDAARAYADFCSFVGGDHKDGVSAMSYSEWCKAPLLCFRVLQNPAEYASTVNVRFTTHVASLASQSMLMFCLHSKCFEAEWQAGETNPSKVLVDEILG